MGASLIGDRLLSVAALVRQDACFADIGTDHAYLPIFLMERGIISSAVCTDINEGPLLSARRNAAEHGMSDRLILRLTDGAVGLSDMGLTDIAICGMGGEMITHIIDSSPFLRDPAINLILQPMTKHAHLRRYLARCGFTVQKEVYSKEGGKYYLTLLASYTDTPREIGDLEAEFGNDLTRVELSEAMRGYLKTRIRALSRAAGGKADSANGDLYEEHLLSELSALIDINDL